MSKRIVAMGSVLLLAVSVFVVVAPAAGEEETQRMFVGTTKCKTCHKTAAQGEQHPIWLKSAHAKAFEVLAGDESKAIAKEKGIEDPQKADECLKCHVTGHGVDAKFLGPKYLASEGVGCESCHGAGGDYYKKTTMTAVLLGEIEPASVGLIIPNEKTCVTCHNEDSPTFKKFDYKEAYAKIAHPIPEERKAKHKAAPAAE